MKIGILTFHRAINYGAVLQCYALQEHLKSMHHDVEIIDYRPEYIEKYRKINTQTPSFSIIEKIKGVIISILKTPLILITNSAFDKFLNSHLSIGDKIIRNTNQVCGYDAIFFGSDQIWSPSICEGLDPIYYGQFSHKGTRLISYAASLGGHNVLSEDSWREVCSKISCFDAISVREKELQTRLESYGLKTKIVVDPSLLMTQQMLDDLAVRPKHTNYVLLFMLEESEVAYKFAQRVAEQTRCSLIRLQSTKAIRHRPGVINVEAVPPELFCGYIKYAKCVINISFHGTAFSILYNKAFYTLHSAQEDRASNLLKTLGLSDRLVSATDDIRFTDIDYSNTNRLIKQLRKDSEKFIKEALS